MQTKVSSHGNIYRIRIKGRLNRQFEDWFGGLTITPIENGETLLEGRFTDQPALRGFLDHLWNLNITIISVERVEDDLEE